MGNPGKERIFFLLLCAAILVWKLFLPGFIGLADNGDFPKVAGPLCLGTPTPTHRFVVPVYARGPEHCYSPQLPTSELPLAWLAAKAANGASFDIRWLGAVHAVVFLFCFALLLQVLAHFPTLPRIVFSCIALWIFTDVVLISYFNSFYMDTAAILGGLLVVFAVASSSGSRVAFAVGATLYAGSKGPHALLGLAVLAPVAWILYRRAVICIPILAASLYVLLGAPQWYSEHTRFNVIFMKVARNAGDLVELGLTADDARYIGTHSFASNSPLDDAGSTFAQRFRSGTSYRQVTAFYLRHPLGTLAQLRDDFEQFSWIRRAPELSNFAERPGLAEGAIDTRFGSGSWSDLRGWLSRQWPMHVALWFALALAWCARLRSPFEKAFVLAMALAVGEFCIASLAEATETARHLMLFHVFTDATILLAVALAGAANLRAVVLGLGIVVASSELPTLGLDDADLGIHYQGKWISQPFQQAFRGTLTYSDQPGASARFSFEGEKLEYIYTKASNRGIATVQIDSAEPVDVDLYAPQTVWRSRTVFANLTPGQHTVEIQVSGRRNAASSGLFVDLDRELY